MMPSYILRNIDPQLWIKVKTRAASENTPLKALIMGWLRRYADGLKHETPKGKEH